MASRIGVLPLEGFGMSGVGLNVTAKFACEVGDGSEDSAGDHLTLDACEPNLELIEPRRVRGSEVEVDVRMFGEKGLYELGFVS